MRDACTSGAAPVSAATAVSPSAKVATRRLRLSIACCSSDTSAVSSSTMATSTRRVISPIVFIPDMPTRIMPPVVLIPPVALTCSSALSASSRNAATVSPSDWYWATPALQATWTLRPSSERKVWSPIFEQTWVSLIAECSFVLPYMPIVKSAPPHQPTTSSARKDFGSSSPMARNTTSPVPRPKVLARLAKAST